VLMIVAIAGLPTRQAPSNWRDRLSELNERFAGQSILVTPRPAGAMVKYYLHDANVLLDSSHPDDRRAFSGRLASGQLQAVLRWGVTVEPGGFAGELIGSRAPTGATRVADSAVSWWDLPATRDAR
jgi:hypothetical protein